MRQHIHIARSRDGTQIAWARAGAGPVLVKASNWLTHLRYDLESPVWRHWIEFFTGHFDFIRYDERGCGLSEREPASMSPEPWLDDLECVIDAARIVRPMILLGVSQGAAAVIRYAIRHPQRVSRLILYGGYAKGWARRDPGEQAQYRAVLEMMRLGWGRDNPVFRQAFTSRFVPGGTHEQLDWFNALCRECVSPDMAVRLLEMRAHVDIEPLLPQLQVATLVLHARHDEVVPVSEGRRLASAIPGAEFVELDSRNHVLLAQEPAWREFQEAVRAFSGTDVGIQAVREPLTRREREVLVLLGDGLSNAQIGRHLAISDKTVRNHLCGVYRKLGVSTRAQAIVRLRRPAGEAG